MKNLYGYPILSYPILSYHYYYHYYPILSYANIGESFLLGLLNPKLVANAKTASLSKQDE
jgi:hypothetical protein